MDGFMRDKDGKLHPVQYKSANYFAQMLEADKAMRRLESVLVRIGATWTPLGWILDVDRGSRWDAKR
jgi:hypothetical protein